MTLMTLPHSPTPNTITPGGFALFALGFRPFYLLAAAFGAVAVPAWVLMLAGRLPLPLPGYWWHSHEMVFGFAAAAIVGFLYTAGRNWTGLPTPSGTPLALLAALWIAGRAAMAFDASGLPSAIIDLAFLPLAAVGFARVLLKAKNRNNYFLVGLLAALALANLGFHLGVNAVAGIDPLRMVLLGLGVVIVVITVIAGRVVPMFTQNAVRGVRLTRRPSLERAAMGSTGLALALWALLPGVIGALVALVAAALQAARMAGWQSWATRKTPMVWVLHLAHAWIAIGLLLVGLAQWGVVAESAAVHALAIGAVGGFIIGMFTRTARGHTARPLVPGRVEVSAYVAVPLAAAVRVATLLALPGAATGGLHLAATLWALAFGAYFVRYLPWLVRPRPDGKPG